jgi:predicted metalloprotease with PDZ domain
MERSMWGRTSSRVSILAVFVAGVGLPARTVAAQAIEPIVYTVRVPAPETHIAEIEAVVPAGGRPSIEMMMPVWTPGFYRVEDYAGRVRELSARRPDGAALAVERTRKNRWRIETGGVPAAVVSYRLSCEGRSVTTNWVGGDLAVFNGAATFLTLVEADRRPHEVRLERPSQWKRTMTALDAAPDGVTDHYRADDFDALADSPIVAGDPAVHEFEVDGSKHALVDLGEAGEWDGARAARDLEKIVRENRRFWGFLPFKRYLFLNVFRGGGGGLEHKDCTLLTSSPPRAGRAQASLRWLEFVSHEYFHAFNVKRLRPIELGPFDYEHPPRTSSLWVSEGLTSYYGELIVVRAGLGGRDDFLSSLSSHIGRLQNAPGRLVQTLEQSSLDVWSGGTSGIGRDADRTVSYYEKGPVVGFLLDARIRRATGGERSLDDLMRLTYARYSGARGFTPEQFRATAEEVAGADLEAWFRRALASTEELDYAEALDWFGLRFASSEGPSKSWKLEARADATAAQNRHLNDLIAPARGR